MAWSRAGLAVPDVGALSKAAARCARLIRAWSWVLVPLAIAVGSRAVVLGVGAIADVLIPDNIDSHARQVLAGIPLLDPWFNWDAAWYATIALDGYQTGGLGPTLAFWPLLPVLEWLASRPLTRVLGLTSTVAVLYAGLVVVYLAFFTGCAMLYRFFSHEFGSDVARRAVLCLAFSPGAIFYTAGYPEGLLLIGVVGCLWALRRKRWALAGAAGCLAAVAHVPGSLLALPFAWEYLRAKRWRPGLDGLWIGLIALGPAVWLAYLWSLTGQPLAPVTAAFSYWPHHASLPTDTLLHWIWLLTQRPEKFALGFLDLAILLWTLTASVWAIRKGYAGWGIWGLAVLTLYLSLPAIKPFEGMLRYTLPVLPIWLLTARLLRHPLAEGLAIGMLALFQGLLTVLYVNRFWVA